MPLEPVTVVVSRHGQDQSQCHWQVELLPANASQSRRLQVQVQVTSTTTGPSTTSTVPCRYRTVQYCTSTIRRTVPVAVDGDNFKLPVETET